MQLNEVKKLLVGTIKQSFVNKKTLDKFDDTTGTLKYNGVPVNNAPVFVADDSPVGNIISFMGNAAPQDYLICDGSEYQMSEYPLLVQHFINEFGSANYFGGDGTETFAVPDLRGEFLRGTGTSIMDNGSGAEVGKHQDGTKTIRMQTQNGNILAPYHTTDTTNIANIDKSYQHDVIKALGKASLTNEFVPTTDFLYYTSRPTNTSVLYCIKYQITQNNISKDMVNYSEEEQVVGSWIDGKPVYQKVFITTVPSASSDGKYAPDKEINISELNIDRCIKYNGFISHPTTKETLDMPYISTNINSVCRAYVATSKVVLKNSHTALNGFNVYIIAQYTKTTDAENSFTPDMLDNIKTLNTTASEEEVNEILGGI